MYLYDQAGYMTTLDTMLYKQRVQETTMYATHQLEPYYQTDDPNKLKDYMDRVSRENLEAKNKLYQAHMRMQSQLQASQMGQFSNFSPQPQDLFQTPVQMQPHPQIHYQTQLAPPQQFQHPGLQQQQSIYQQAQMSPQLQQQLQQSLLQQKLTQSPQLQISLSQQQQQQLLQQASPLSVQLVPSTPAYSSMTTPVPQQLTPQQVYQLQVAQQKRTEAYARNKEKLSQMTQLPYGWQFDPNVPLVC